MNIGFIGYGEAAFNITLGLKGEGVTGIHATDAMLNHEVMGKTIHSRAEQAGVTLVETSKEVAQWADILFAAVPSTFTMDVCNEIKDCLRPGQLYVDVSSSTPTVKIGVWEAIKDSGVSFVDAAMMGFLARDKHKVPIKASGVGAVKFQELMTPYGMNIEVVGEKPGAASAIKLVRSIFMKGIEALAEEMLQAADAYDVTDEVVDSIAQTMDSTPFKNQMNQLVTTSAIHCKRRASEVKGCIALLEDKGLAADMSIATKKRLDLLASFNLSERYAGNVPANYQDVIDAMKG